MIAGGLSTLPRNAAAVSSSKTDSKRTELGLKDSAEKLYQPPDSGGRDFYFLRFQYLSNLSCARHFHVCVKKKNQTDQFKSIVIYFYFMIHARVFHLGLVYCLYEFVSCNELWDTTKTFSPIPNWPIVINITLNLLYVWWICALCIWVSAAIDYGHDKRKKWSNKPQ